MKKFAKAIAVIAVSAAAFVGFTGTSSAAEVNFGQCHRGLDNPQWQAPGQSGNGPLTIVKGRLVFPAAYDGAQGCNKA